MEEKVTIRKVETYQVDDGRKIQVYTFLKDASKIIPEPIQVKTTIGINKNIPIDFNKEVNYVGFNAIPTPIGTRQISFKIEEATSIVEAFELFDKYYEPAFNKEVKLISEEIEKMNKQVKEPKISRL